MPALISYIKTGLAGGEQCIYIADGEIVREVHHALEANGIDLIHESERGSLLFWTSHEWSHSGEPGSVNPDVQLNQLIDAALRAGFKGIRFSMEMNCVLAPDISVEHLNRWETAVDSVLARNLPVRMICQYSRHRFSSTVIKAALTSHPTTILDNWERPNFFYEAPGVLDGGSETSKVDWMISQLKKAHTEFAEVEHQATERYQNLQQVYLLNDMVTRAKTLDEIYQTALTVICQSLRADRAAILLMDDEKMMRFKAWQGISEHYREAVEGHSPWPADVIDPHPICISNIDQSDLNEHLRNLVHNEGIRALAFFPLLHQRQLIGKIMVYYNTPHEFSEEEIRLLQTIGRHVAFSIERKMSEERMFRTSRLESIGEMVGGLAHDFNNILATIMGNLSVAKILVKPETTVFKRLERSQKAVLRAQSITQQLLAFSKKEGPVKQVLPMIHLLKDLAAFALQGSNVRCEFSIPENLSSIEADEGEIRQAIHNIILNAREAMADGGILRIRAQNVAFGPENALSLQAGDYIKVSINDNGVGIAKDCLSKIFDPLFTTKPDRTGLGLTRTYRIIEQHEGSISVESERETGTTFTIYLPCTTELPVIKNASEEGIVRGKGRILFMDDEAEIREVAREMLIGIGYEVECCRDGMEATHFLRRAQEQGQSFDVAILDLTVRGGMGGKEVIDKLQEIDPQVKVIISSGYSNDPVLLDFKEFGFSGRIAKPYTLENLSNALKVLFGRNNKLVNSK
jgi:signal transduction histidine kinase/ActR/RegA family two-component response regulator